MLQALGSDLLLIGVAVLLVLLNGFYVAAEFSLVKLRPTRVKALAAANGWRGRILARVHEELDAYLSACQLGITLASLALGWVGEPAFADLLSMPLAALGIESPEVVHAVAITLAFTLISFLHIVAGELAPKSLAIRLPERVGLWTAAPLYAFYWGMYPAIWALNHSSNWLLRRLRLDPESIGKHHEGAYSSDELRLILRTSRADATKGRDQWQMVSQALDFREMEVGELMRPFREAVTLSRKMSKAENLARIVQYRYSRYPYLDELGQVIGIVHLKDLFLAEHRGGLTADSPEASLEDMLRPAYVVPPNLAATALVTRFREGAGHFAIVANHEGRPLGFVTMDNALGALVGEIRDEFRQPQTDWIHLDDGSMLGKASLPIYTLERLLGVQIDTDEADTVGGLIYWKLGEVPKEGQRVAFDGFDMVVKRMTGPRILLVRVYPHPAAAES